MPESDGSGDIIQRSPADTYAADASLTEAELPAAIVAAAEALAAPRQPGPGLWQNREFRIVLLGQAISALGDAITLTVLPLLVVALTGSGIAMGIVGRAAAAAGPAAGAPGWCARRPLGSPADDHRRGPRSSAPDGTHPALGDARLADHGRDPAGDLPHQHAAGAVPGRLDGGDAVDRGKGPGRTCQRLRGGHLQRFVRHRTRRSRDCWSPSWVRDPPSPSMPRRSWCPRPASHSSVARCGPTGAGSSRISWQTSGRVSRTWPGSRCCA